MTDITNVSATVSSIIGKPIVSPSQWSHTVCRLESVSDAVYLQARSIKGMERFPDKAKMAKAVVRGLDHGSEVAYADKMTEEGLNTFVIYDETAKKAAPKLRDKAGKPLDAGSLVWIADFRKAIKGDMPKGLKTVEHTVGAALKYDAQLAKLKKSDPALHACYVAIRNRASIYCSGQWKKWVRHFEEAKATAAGVKKKKGTRASTKGFRERFFAILEAQIKMARTAAERKTPDATAPHNTAAFTAFIKQVEKEFDALMQRIAGDSGEETAEA